MFSHPAAFWDIYQQVPGTRQSHHHVMLRQEPNLLFHDSLLCVLVYLLLLLVSRGAARLSHIRFSLVLYLLFFFEDDYLNSDCNFVEGSGSGRVEASFKNINESAFTADVLLPAAVTLNQRKVTKQQQQAE